MVKVFVCHSRDDRNFIEQEVFSVLHAAGIETWYAPDDIRASQRWERSILEALKTVDYFLLVMSPRSARSHAGAHRPPPRQAARPQKLGFVENGVSCSSCVQQERSWVCR